MIYKLDNGGVIKLQKAGSVPEYGNIEQIAKYNREHGTHFWKMSQVLEHDKQQAQQKTQDKKKSFWEILAGHPESSGEAILNKTIETANNTKLPETRKKIYNDTAKSELGTVAASAMTVPMLGEFTTYGLWGGLGRIAGGFGGSAVGSWGLGKAGDWADKQFGTNWMGTTGRIVGGFAGWPIGSNIGYKGALDFGLKVPQIAKIGSTNQFAKDVGVRGMIKAIETTPNLPIGPLRYAIKTSGTPWYANFWNSRYELFDTLTGKPIGKLGTTFDIRHNTTGIPNEDIIVGTEGTRGVSRALYNAALHDKPEGLISGDMLVHPEITEHVWTHFPREIVSVNGGTRPKAEDGSAVFGPIVRLKQPETFIPTLTKNNTMKFTPKQTRVISEGTYPLYTGPQHSISEIVNLDGTINPRAALRIQREIADNIPGAYRMETRLENPEWHLLDPTTWDHTKQVAKSAWTIPTPKGFTKQDQMVTALGHDFGKIVAGEGHGPIGADLISQIFPDATTAQLTAIREHMGMPKTPLGLVTKQADILNGQSAIIRTVQPNGKIRLSLPSHTDSNPRQFVLEPQGNNKFYVHMRTWDGDHIPANLSPIDKTTLFNALYEELPEGAEILFPQSGPGNYATRGTVAGLQHLARDSRFRPGSKGILKYVDKDGTIKTFEGSSFIKEFPEVKNGNKVIPFTTIPQKPVSTPYEIKNLGGGYMLKSLMQGNPLEKQIGKNGTVNVNNVRALINKGSKVEQAVVDKVLASEEFAGKKAIDYNQFRKAIQDELITYDRAPDTRWETYGMPKLGYDDANATATYREQQRIMDDFVRDHDDVDIVWGGNNPALSIGDEDFVELSPETIIERLEQYDSEWFRTHPRKKYSSGANPSTYTFSSPRIPMGSRKHYDPNTLGHSRTYTTTDEPDVLHVMESQSDWAQQAKRGKAVKDVEKAKVEYQNDILRADKLQEENLDILDKLDRGIRPDGTKIEHDYEYRDIREIVDRNEQNRQTLLSRAKKYDFIVHPEKYEQELYLQDNYVSRQIQENLRYAAEKGQTKMRYPTKETAIKIEGYDSISRNAEEEFNDEIRDIITSFYNKNVTWQTGRKRSYEDIEKIGFENLDKYIKSTNPDADKLISEREKMIRQLTGEYKKVPDDFVFPKEIRTILKKYSDFPKQFKKLYKNADVRIVTDSKGNTWYEVDVPENYLQQEWAYKQGGILKAQNGDLIGPPVPKSIQYTVKAGDSLGKIAKENGLSLDQLLQSNPQYKANPNKVAIGNIVKIPFKKLPPTIFSIPESEDYTIKKGDTLSKIANENGVSLSEVLKLNPKYKNNPNLIVVGQKIKLPKSQKYEPTWQNIEDVRLKESEFNKNNLSAIQSVQHTGNYVVVDKKNHKVTVYDKFNQPLYTSNRISTGASGNDYNTITYVDKDGNIRSGVGNMSTPAGITTITSVGNYHGYPAFQRARVGTNDEIASSFHFGNVCTKSNGCVRMDGKTLSDLDKYIKKGTPVYTLPEQEGSRFVVRDGKLSFVADNTYGVDFGPRLYKAKDRSQYETNEDYLEALEKERVSRENFAERVKTNKNFAQLINGRSFDEVLNSDDYKKRFWDDYNVYVDKTYNPLGIDLKDNNKSKRWNFNAKTFADQISDSKSKIMSDFGLDSDTYNTLAQLAVGIAEQETKFGTSKKKFLKDVVGDKTISFVKHLGDTYNYLSKEKLFTERSSFVPSIAGTFIPSIAKAFDETKNVPHHNSKGYTQIKLTGDNKEMQKIYKKYNITPENIDKNPNLSAVATMLRLAHMYNSEIKGRKFTDANGNTINPMDALLYKWMGKNKELVNFTATPDKNKYIKNVHNYSTNFDYYTLK